MRVFIAVEISDEVRRAIAQRIDVLRNVFSDLRVGWEQPEKLHLTLKFLGETNADQLPELIKAAEIAAKDFQPFALTIESVGVFPPRGAARVLWHGVEDKTKNLQKINQKLEDELARLGFEREKRRFSPHLTIARLREPNKSAELVKMHLQTGFDAVSFLIDHITIFQSQLTSSGLIYRELAQINFPNSAQKE